MNLIQWSCRFCRTEHHDTRHQKCIKCGGRESVFAAIATCKTCVHWVNSRTGEGCELHPISPCRIVGHIVAGGGCIATEPRFQPFYVTPRKRQPKPRPKPKPRPRHSGPIDLGSIRAAPFDRIGEVSLVTFHFNPLRYHRLRDTYYQWLPTLGPLADSLRCYELVFDDDEPEIDGSIVIRGTRDKHWMWQKEALINRALRDSEDANYFGWLDHDMVFSDPNWLARACDKIDAGAFAVQPFDLINYTDEHGKYKNSVPGRVSQVRVHGNQRGNPGGAWIADRSTMTAIGGLIDDNIVGGGDQPWIAVALGNKGTEYLDRHAGSDVFCESNRRWIDHAREVIGNRECSYLEQTVSHIYHGPMHKRQYLTRDTILANHAFDPATDITRNADGILEWSSEKPGLHEDVRKFFEGRDEDG